MSTRGPRNMSTRRERLTLRTARAVSGIMLFIGMVGLLRVGTTGETMDLTGLTVAPLTGIIWLAIGIVGIALGVGVIRARLFLIGAGALLVAWGLAALLSGGASDVLTDDPTVVGLHLVLGGGSLVVALVPTPGVVRRTLAIQDAEEPEPPADTADAVGGGVSASRRGTHSEG